MKSRNIFVVLALAACAGNNKDNPDKGPGQETGDTDTSPPTGVPTVWVNEVMAQNQETLADESGYYPDWVELWNPNEEAVDLSGWWLSDDRDDPFKWQFPDGTSMAAGEYLVIFCDEDDGGTSLHASFHLAGLGGEDLALFGPNVLDNPLVDLLENMSIQLPDVSLARMPDGGPTWSQDETATPAASNN